MTRFSRGELTIAAAIALYALATADTLAPLPLFGRAIPLAGLWSLACRVLLGEWPPFPFKVYSVPDEGDGGGTAHGGGG